MLLSEHITFSTSPGSFNFPQEHSQICGALTDMQGLTHDNIRVRDDLQNVQSLLLVSLVNLVKPRLLCFNHAALVKQGRDLTWPWSRGEQLPNSQESFHSFWGVKSNQWHSLSQDGARFLTVASHNCFNQLPLLQLLGGLTVFSENILRTKVLSWSQKLSRVPITQIQGVC